MNNILTLRGNRFEHRSRHSGGGNIELPGGSCVRLAHLKDLHTSLTEVRKFWENNDVISGVLVSVYYNRIVSKSNRIRGYLYSIKNEHPIDTVVGARFNSDKNKHIITHFISKENLDKTIKKSNQIIALFEDFFAKSGLTTSEFKNGTILETLPYSKYSLTKTDFKQYLRDACFVENFGVETIREKALNKSVITFYDVNVDAVDILKRIGITISRSSILDKMTVLLDEKYVKDILDRIPYLISMAVEDFSILSPDDFKYSNSLPTNIIPSPTNEPTIGVIDTLFDQNVYFSEWVEYNDFISDEIPKVPEDYDHGTAVTSLIVDAPNINPNLDDGCGRFKVRHFGVALHRGFSSFSIIQNIKRIVSQNLDIKVWNLSLGAMEEVSDDSISIEGAVLDEIQFEYDVIFVVAGTNYKMKNNTRKKIGSPADSLNSLTVNAVDFNNCPTDYTRRGEVLSFFIKPDISYYGGDSHGYINVCRPLGLHPASGTSYAAPLVSRKLAYLINIMGLSREEAKALLIDSAISWRKKMSYEDSILMGHGVIPIKIKDILSSSDDEIKFIVSDVSDKFDTYNYNFPVPIFDKKYPYVARATLCYFPKCSRNQGVDYTNTELKIIFGRLHDSKRIESINKDKQYIDDAPSYIREAFARKEYRKWDNVKCISESFTERNRARDILNPSNPQWGMSIQAVERLGNKDGRGIKFGVVVTLKEIKGINRIEDFINQASLRGWIVNRLEVENQIDIYNVLSEDINFE
ncbi:MAG: S8 family peptidase [Ruminobacter sp.]|uniref:S8 family peptidase n=1 Tax=Ruminobacter sp. TaxID=2774296 RepID=UPI001B6B6393|nr:S8 family peptidase [Ruminobacter sp.]MBP3749481.1 S8 family peptidase [Ruminobacter sp.]